MAGLLMFGGEDALADPATALKYHLDYRERPTNAIADRWTDRLTIDGTWTQPVPIHPEGLSEADRGPEAALCLPPDDNNDTCSVAVFRSGTGRAVTRPRGNSRGPRQFLDPCGLPWRGWRRDRTVFRPDRDVGPRNAPGFA